MTRFKNLRRSYLGHAQAARRWKPVFLLMVVIALISGTSSPGQGQPLCTYAAGSVVRVEGTSYVFIADEEGALHWANDARALDTRTVNWSDQCQVDLASLQASMLGDPWLSTGLMAIGDSVYVLAWEDAHPLPTLRHARSMAELQALGLTDVGIGAVLRSASFYQDQYGWTIGTLRVGPLSSMKASAWSTSQRADYGQLLEFLTTAESQALLTATSSGIDPWVTFAAIAQCEQLALTGFERSFAADTAKQSATTCLSETPIPGSTLVPTPPGNVGITEPRPEQLQLTWVESPGATGYRTRGVAYPQAPVLAGTGRAPATHTLITTDIAPATYYCYTVSALNSYGESPPGGPACVMTSRSGRPLSPRMRVSTDEDGENQLDWTPVSSSGVDGYRVLRDTVQSMGRENAEVLATLGADARSFTDLTPTPGIQNCYTVAPFNTAGERITGWVCARVTDASP